MTKTHQVVLPAGEVLARIERLLDRVDADRTALAPAARLEWVRAARQVRDRLDALYGLLVGEAEKTGASMRAAGTPLTSWLGRTGRLSRREASAVVLQGKALSEHPAVGQAAATGRVGAGQARAIGRVLEGLATQLDTGQQAEAEQVLLGLADHLDADQLAKAAPRVLAEVAPADAEELLETRLQRQAEAAWRNRSLVFAPDEHGSVKFTGSLPTVEAHGWIAMLNAYTESARRSAIEQRDRLAPSLTPAQRRADALLAMLADHQRGRKAPAVAGDRPRIVVTVDYAKLTALAAGAGLIGDREPISAGELRRLCCDADILPAVLGGASEVLDVGREARLVTPAIRAALNLRDGGCVFPGCNVPPEQTEAHHIQPWYHGGPTALGNLVLLCHHHHGLVEPAKYGIRDQWQIRIGVDGIPETIPPARCDPGRAPIRHARHRRERAPASGLAPPAA